MKKFIINIIVFFAIMSFVDLAIGHLGDYLQAHPMGGDTRRVNNLIMKDKHDILILGSSRAHHHYDSPFLSDTLGVDVYNAGFDGNGVILAYGFLEMILERYQPRLVVFDVEPAFDINVYTPDNNHVRYLGMLKPYYNQANICDIFKDVSIEEWYKVHSGLIRYNSTLIPKLIDYTMTRSADEKGYIPIYAKFEGSPSYARNNYELDNLKLEYIEKFIKLTKCHNVHLILVASPKLGAKDSQVFQPVLDLCKKNGVNFLDYYSDPRFQNRSFYAEPMHLNNLGARVFTKDIYNVIDTILKSY